MDKLPQSAYDTLFKNEFLVEPIYYLLEFKVATNFKAEVKDENGKTVEKFKYDIVDKANL